MTSVYLLWHLGHKPEDGEDDPLLLGVFSSEERALAWQHDAVKLPGFRDWPDRFVIARSTVDQREWVDGFETLRHPAAEPAWLTLTVSEARDLLSALQGWAQDGPRSERWRHRLSYDYGGEITIEIEDEN